MKQRQDLIAGLLLMGIAGFGLLDSRDLPQGAAMLPVFALGAIAVLSLLMIGRSLIAMRAGRTDSTDDKPFIAAPKRLAIGIVAMGLYIGAIQILGFYLASAIFMPATALALGARNIKAIALGSAGFLGFVYAVFTVIFDRVLPTGILFSILMLIAGGGHV